MDQPALRRILIGLTVKEPTELARLSAKDWVRLDAMAAQHRLQPLLHAFHRDDGRITGDIRAGWRAAHRSAAMVSLAQQADLAETAALLEARGFAPIALKGSYLAWHAYPEPALRPMRDLDLLVEPETVVPAFGCLQAAGYRLGEAPEMPLADIVRLEKHLPVLIAPRGTPVELHHRLWEPSGRLDHATPAPAEADIRQRAIRLAGIAFPAPEDTLAHLIVHAVYGHRLDCGPLVLSDLRFLAQGQVIDWDRFWGRAERKGWAGAAGLLFALARLPLPRQSLEPPSALLALAPDLLLQNLGTRQSAGFGAAVITGGPAALLRRLTGKRQATGVVAARRDMAGEGGALGWAWSRLRRTVGDLASGEVRRQSRDLARLSRWLGSNP